jgi:23S rRNA (cytidine1920-2'-O)/16S rRNA (cytidine1409-2'-O)-methyltransferase
MSEKVRLDMLLVERGLAQNRERAQALILAGDVLVAETPAQKSGQLFSRDVLIRLKKSDHPYVSRGALKLIGALEAFPIDPKGKLAIDVGASTGGFTEVLLERGARRVYALDVGYNQLAWKIRTDPRVEVFEKVNARSLPQNFFAELPALLVMDVSFISVKKLLPALLPNVTEEADWVVLIKPQFEVGREKVGKGGIVRDEAARLEAVEDVIREAARLGLKKKGFIDSPIEGTDGNREYLVWLNRAL